MSSPIAADAPSQHRKLLGIFAAQLRLARTPLLILGHLGIFVFVFWIAFLLRFDLTIPREYRHLFVQSLPAVVFVKLAVFYLVGHYHGWWRYVTFADLASLLKAATIAMAALVGLDHFVLPFQIPRSVVILDWALTILVIGAMRSACRVALEQSLRSGSDGDVRRALIIGAGFESSRLASLIRSHPEWRYDIVGLVAINGEATKKHFGTSAIIGKLDDIIAVASKKRATEILLRAGMIPGSELRELMDRCTESSLTLKVVPDLKSHLDGSDKIPMRDIEITDLLRRDPVQLDTTSIAQLVEGKTVMVTGAGGSIGSELCRQIIKYRPHAIILLGRGENRIFEIDVDLRALKTDTVIHARIASVTDEVRMRQLYATHRPDIVFHAAAHKHVPLMEDNIAEAVQNNVLGTKIVADLADECEVERFVFISTDKAVNPTSVMGRTKQLGERYVMALASESATRFMVVRFGNVLASTGSVVPLFKKQIQNGGPITVTDERMTRFFMTIPEASQLVLQAAAIGQDGQIIVLDMGEQIPVIDMARDLIRLAGLPEDAIDIEITGIRPGEKLYEELFDDQETVVPMSHAKLRAAQYVPATLSDVQTHVAELTESNVESDELLRRMTHKTISAHESTNGLPVELTTLRGKDLAPVIAIESITR